MSIRGTFEGLKCTSKAERLTDPPDEHQSGLTSGLYSKAGTGLNRQCVLDSALQAREEIENCSSVKAFVCVGVGTGVL
jgi:hypothetical protein